MALFVRRAPLPLQIIAAALMVAPVFYYIAEALAAGLPVTDPGPVIAHFGTLRLIGVLLAPLVGVVVLTVAPVAWFTTVGYALFTIAFNVRALASGHTTGLKAFLFSCVGVVVIAYFVRREIRAPYFSPRLGVWVRDRIEFALRVEIEGQAPLTCTTFDVSSSGCFLVTERELAAGDQVAMVLHLPDGPVRATGTVVWRSDGTRKPKGLGIRFDSARGLRSGIASLTRAAA